jgi:four helix bundle protein
MRGDGGVSDCIAKSFDFGIRVVELSRWLKGEGKEFPLADRLTESGTGLRALLLTAKAFSDRDCRLKAFLEAAEAEYLLELMVKTNFITELQSEPLLSDCRSIKRGILSMKAVRKHNENGGIHDGK